MPLEDTHPLPELAARWLAAALPGALTAQQRSPCDACPQCPTADGPALAYAFDPEVKCCAHLPELPNYLVGAALRDLDATSPGAVSLRARIAGRVAADPLGLGRSAERALIDAHAVNVQGRSRSLRCPHFAPDSGTCSIHGHRNHHCAAYFCRPQRGRAGHLVWEAVGRLLGAAERAVALHCALEAGLEAAHLASLRADADAPRSVDAATADSTVGDALWAARWGPWAGREEALYAACAERADALSWSDVRALGGVDLRVLEEIARARVAARDDAELPERLRVGVHQVLAVGAGGARVVTWSALDPIELPALLLSVLHYFDGRPTAEAFAAIERERGIRLDGPLVQQLRDHLLLIGG